MEQTGSAKPRREVPAELRPWMDKDPLVSATMMMYLDGSTPLQTALLCLATCQTERADRLHALAFRRLQVDPPVIRIEVTKEQWEAIKPLVREGG